MWACRGVIPQVLTTWILKKGSSLAWDLTSSLGWLAGKVQRICLFLLHWSISMWHLVWLFIWVLGIKHGSLQLHRKHITDWTILPGPIFTLLIGIWGGHERGVEIEHNKLNNPHSREFHNYQKSYHCLQVYLTWSIHFSDLGKPCACWAQSHHFQRWAPFRPEPFHRNLNQLNSHGLFLGHFY